MHIPPLIRWVRPRLVPLALGLASLPLAAVVVGQDATPPAARVVRLSAAGDATAPWAARVDGMQRAGTLRLRSSVEDAMVDGRVHDRFEQYAGDARIYGAQVVRQRSAGGVETVFGELFPDDLGISTTPRLSAAEASARVTEIAGRAPVGWRAPELVVLPMDDGTFRLTWLSQVRIGGDVLSLFVDARSGDEVLRFSALRRQSAVGTGTGVLGERKKLATRQASGTFFSDDALRPPTLITYDFKGNFTRLFDVLDGVTPLAQSDVATDADNTWTDGPVVDGHAGIGYTYDYYFARFNRRGFDNNNRPMRTVIHPANRDNLLSLPDEVIGSFLLNAFWCPDCGSAANPGIIVFGDGLPARFTLDGQNVNYFSAGFDIVAHEYTHAVTSYTSDLVYLNESGALNESFSDMMAVGAEFYLVASGRSTRPGDYLLGEDAFTPAAPGALVGTRSLSDPLAYGYPDNYSVRFTGREDNGGVHINSSISNHAFFLAIEGGTNRTSRLTVQGVGAANREQIERVFYRGFTTYLTPRATFAQARQATLRAASDLYGDTSPAFRAVSQAWTAVGVN